MNCAFNLNMTAELNWFYHFQIFGRFGHCPHSNTISDSTLLCFWLWMGESFFVISYSVLHYFTVWH